MNQSVLIFINWLFQFCLTFYNRFEKLSACKLWCNYLIIIISDSMFDCFSRVCGFCWAVFIICILILFKSEVYNIANMSFWNFQTHQPTTMHHFADTNCDIHPYFSISMSSKHYFFEHVHILHLLFAHQSELTVSKTLLLVAAVFLQIFQSCPCCHKNKHLFVS